MKKVTASMREREQILKDLSLSVNVRVTKDGGTKMAPMGIMQEKVKQHMILVAGPGREIHTQLSLLTATTAAKTDLSDGSSVRTGGKPSHCRGGGTCGTRPSQTSVARSDGPPHLSPGSWKTPTKQTTINLTLATRGVR